MKFLAIVSSITMGILVGAVLLCDLEASAQPAPAFSLKDVKGQVFELSQLKDRSMAILYFFDVESRPSQEGLLSLNQLARRFGADLAVWAITASAASASPSSR